MSTRSIGGMHCPIRYRHRDWAQRGAENVVWAKVGRFCLGGEGKRVEADSTSRNVADLVKRGIAAAKAKQREQARQLLTRAVELDEGNVTAWLWLSGVTQSLEDREVCLENVLALDADNAVARRGLDQLRKQKVESLFRRGVIAAKSGHAERAQELLTQVVELDQDHVSAWLWLSGVVPSLEDREVCLENVLALDPDNAAARKGLLQVREALGPRMVSLEASAEVVDPAPPPDTTTAPTLWVSEELDDELLCPYCAHPTRPRDRECESCRRNLWIKVYKKQGRSVMLWIMIVFQGLGVLSTLCNIAFLPSAIAEMQAELDPGVVSTAIISSVVYLIIQVALLVGTYVRWKGIFYMHIGNTILLLLGGLALMALSFESVGSMACGSVFLIPAVLWLALVLAIRNDFAYTEHRLFLRLDPKAQGINGFLRRGHQYAEQKMWALAALHLNRAVQMMPNSITGRAALAQACIKLKRYDLADQVLDNALQIDPHHAQLGEIKKIVAGFSR